MMPRLGFSLEKEYDRPIQDVIRLLKAAGFSAVSPVWDPDLNLEALDSCLRSESMVIQSLHAPHKNVATLWKPGSQAALEARKAIIQCLEDCQHFQIPVMVLHCWQGHHYTFPTTALDFHAFDEFVDEAKHRGVCIALENLEGEEYLAALMERYKHMDHIGFCWDSGHDLCYPHQTDFLKHYGNRLMMTHLNDNWGLRDPSGVPSKLDDLHLLPGDGNVDWNQALRKLAQAPAQTILNFEIKKSAKSKNACDQRYVDMPLEKFLEESGKRGFQIAEIYAMMNRDM